MTLRVLFEHCLLYILWINIKICIHVLEVHHNHFKSAAYAQIYPIMFRQSLLHENVKHYMAWGKRICYSVHTCLPRMTQFGCTTSLFQLFSSVKNASLEIITKNTKYIKDITHQRQADRTCYRWIIWEYAVIWNRNVREEICPIRSECAFWIFIWNMSFIAEENTPLGPVCL